MMYLSYFLMTLLGLSGLFLIGLILLQRGRGGGLAGAFGGMGGGSAFGTKAGDVFTKITIGVASFWILLCAGSVLALQNSQVLRYKAPEIVEPVQKAASKDKDDELNDEAAPKDMKEEAPVKQPKKDDEGKPAATEEKKPEEKKPEEKKPEEEKKPAETPAAAEADKPKDEANPKEEAKPKDEAKPNEAAEKKPEEPKAADPKPEPKAE